MVNEGQSLTATEKQVLRLKQQGLSNRQAAGRQFVSPRTIEFHLQRIYSKLGVSNCLAALAKSREIGVLTDDSD